MFVQFIIALIILAILYKYLRAHGCGLACQRRPPGAIGQRDVRGDCTCVCATCPCSPMEAIFEALEVVPNTLAYCQDKVSEWMCPRCHDRSAALQKRAQFSDSHIIYPAPIVIEEAKRSRAGSRLSDPAVKHAEPGIHISEPCIGLSEIYGKDSLLNTGTRETPSSSKPTPALKATSTNVNMDEHTCNKCKAKGMTCMRTCPKAKAKNTKNATNNTDT